MNIARAKDKLLKTLGIVKFFYNQFQVNSFSQMLVQTMINDIEDAIKDLSST